MNWSGWGIWEKEPSKFDWAYTEEERSYIIDRMAEIRADEGTVEIEKRDYVVFPMGLKCTWVVKEGIRKYCDFYIPIPQVRISNVTVDDY